MLSANILSLKIPPDTRISVDSLARQLGFSQTPIREALSMLEAIGLVTKKQFAGYCTAPKLSLQKFEELFEIRLLLEPLAARRAAEEMSDSEIEELRALVQRMELDSPCPSERFFADQDSEFHERVARGSGNALVVEILARLHAHLHITRLRFDREVTSEGVSEHALILQALQRRSPGDAEAAMREHIEKSHDRLVLFAER